MNDDYDWDDFVHDMHTIPAWCAIGVGLAAAAPFALADWLWEKICEHLPGER